MERGMPGAGCPTRKQHKKADLGNNRRTHVDKMEVVDVPQV